jgi:hypothetical protein
MVDEEQHTGPPRCTLALPINTESSYPHFCLDASSDGGTSQTTLHNLPPPLNNSPDDGNLRIFQEK